MSASIDRASRKTFVSREERKTSLAALPPFRAPPPNVHPRRTPRRKRLLALLLVLGLVAALRGAITWRTARKTSPELIQCPTSFVILGAIEGVLPARAGNGREHRPFRDQFPPGHARSNERDQICGSGSPTPIRSGDGLVCGDQPLGQASRDRRGFDGRFTRRGRRSRDRRRPDDHRRPVPCRMFCDARALARTVR